MGGEQDDGAIKEVHVGAARKQQAAWLRVAEEVRPRARPCAQQHWAGDTGEGRSHLQPWGLDCPLLLLVVMMMVVMVVVMVLLLLAGRCMVLAPAPVGRLWASLLLAVVAVAMHSRMAVAAAGGAFAAVATATACALDVATFAGAGQVATVPTAAGGWRNWCGAVDWSPWRACGRKAGGGISL